MTIKTAAILVAAIGALGLTAPASANPARSAAAIQRVSYGDLNLMSAEGRAELQRRVNKAAVKACQYEQDGAMRDSQTRGRCFRESRQRATVQVAPLIAAAGRPRLGG